MDKYEFNIKVEQIKKLFNKSDYGTAMKIADTIDWRRVRNTNLLSMVATIYEKNEDYEEAKEILLLAYERAPIGKRLLYKLAELALKQGNVSEAEDYYKEFGELASDDPRQQLLRYMILKTKGAPAQQLIHSLESYLSVELDERWLYELAELYSLAGMSDRCVETCDKIMLMFGLGKYVEKAMDLKTQYAPLTNYQLDLVENRDKYEEKLRQVEQQYSLGKKRMAEEEAYHENRQAYQDPPQTYQGAAEIQGYSPDTGYVPEQEYMPGNGHYPEQGYQVEQGYTPDNGYGANQDFGLYQGGAPGPEYALGQGYESEPGYEQIQGYAHNPEFESVGHYSENINYNPGQVYFSGQQGYGENLADAPNYAAETESDSGQSLETRENYIGNQYYDAGRNYGASLNYGTRQNFAGNQNIAAPQNHIGNQNLQAVPNYSLGQDYEQNHSTDQGYEASEDYVPEPGYVANGAYESEPGYVPESGYDTIAQSYKTVPGYEPEPGYEAKSGYDSAQGYEALPGYESEPGYDSAQGYKAVPAYETESGYDSAQSYEPVPGYDTAQGYGVESGYDTAQGYGVESGYDTAQGYGVESGYDAAQGYGVESGYDTAQGYGVELGYDTAQGYKAEPSYDTVPDHESEPGYDTAQSYEAISGNETAQNYESEPSCNTAQGYEFPRGYVSEEYNKSGQSYEPVRGYDPEEGYKSDRSYERGKGYNSSQSNGSEQEYIVDHNSPLDHEYNADSNYEYRTDEGFKAEEDYIADQGYSEGVDYSLEQDSEIDQDYGQKGPYASGTTANVEKIIYPDYDAGENIHKQDQESYHEYDFQQNLYGTEHSLLREESTTDAAYGSREPYEDGINQSQTQGVDQVHLMTGDLYYDQDSPIEDNLKARLQEAEVQEKLAREMSRISHEDVSMQDESRMDHTRVLDDIRRVGRPITAIPRPRGVYIPEEEHFTTESEPVIEEEVVDGPGLVEDGDEYDQELGGERYNSGYAAEVVRPAYASREAAATAQLDNISPIQAKSKPEQTKERKINYQSTVYEEPDLEFEDLDDEEGIPVLNHLMIEARTPEKGMQVAVEALKQIHKENGIKNPVAKISGEKLSKRGVLASAEKLAGKDLVVEEAGDMTSEALNELAELINNDTSGIIVVLIDNPKQMEAIHREHPALAAKFECIGTGDTASTAESVAAKDIVREKLPPVKIESNIKPQPRKAEEHYKEEPIHYRNYSAEELSYFQKAWDQGEYGEEDSYYENDSYEDNSSYEDDSSYEEDDFYEEDEVENRPSVRDEEGPGFHGEEMDIDEFAQYACRYANEIDCNITGKSMLALYERIEIMEEDGVSLTRDNAEDLIEEAADRAEKPSLGKRLKGLFSSKYDKDGLLILKEEHFIY